MISRRELLQAGSGAAALLGTGASWGQSDVARILVGFPAGGGPDAVARKLADKMAPSYAPSVIVENKPGAGGQLAVASMKTAPADGSTILICAMAILGVYPHTYKKLPYDPIADLTPVTVGVTTDYAWVVGPAVPASVTNLTEYTAWAKANKDKATFGSPAMGSPLHFWGIMLGRAAGVELTHVGYRGSQLALQDLMGGQVPAICCPVGETLRHLSSGRLRVLATSGATRNRFVPGAKTFKEQGLSELVSTEWYGFFLPARASAATVQKLNVSLTQALMAPDVMEYLGGFGLEAAPGTPEALGDRLKSDMNRWGRIVKDIGFTADT